MAAADPESADPRIGTVLSERYRINALLGEGGMGKVYAAEHVLMRKRLAVKVLHRELTLVPEVVARFEREAMAAANVDHPNVAAATDFGRLADGSVFLVLEFVQGRSLRDEIGAGRMPVERAVHIARQIGSALRGAHAHGIVHRDLKPENVMLVDREGDPDFVKVLDFGVAKVPLGEVPSPGSTPISRAGMVFGTPEYMAPEQALGETVDGRADLYALGVMFFEMLAGVRPFVSESPVGILGQQLSQPPPFFADRVGPGLVPPIVERAVHRLLARDKDRRPATAREVEDALASLLVPSATASGTRFTLAVGSAAPLENDLFAHEGSGSQPPSASGAPPAEAPGERSWVRAVASVFESLPPKAEAIRERLPPGLRDSLRPVPAKALALAGVAGIGLVAVLALAVLGVLGRSLLQGDDDEAQPAKARPTPPVAARTPSPPQPESAPPATALEPRPVSGARAVVAGEGEVLAQSALAESKKGDHSTALVLVERAVSVEPALSADDRLSTVVLAAARRPPTLKQAFELLEGPLAGRGAELIWDLASDKQAPPAARQRAARWLRSASFRRAAPEPLRLAADLRTAKSCERARELLTSAKDIGDERSLSQLEAWQARTGCGKNQQEDCMPPTRGRPARGSDRRDPRATGASLESALSAAGAAAGAEPCPPTKSDRPTRNVCSRGAATTPAGDPPASSALSLRIPSRPC